MPLYGADCHPVFQRGLNIEQVAREVDFLAVKVSEGIDSSYLAQGSADWIARATRAGLPVLGYHYLRPGNEDQQAWIFAEVLRTTGGIPGMLDAEALTTGAMGHPAGTLTDSGGMGRTPHLHGGLMPAEHLAGATSPSLTTAGIRYFLQRCAAHGATVPLLYLPQWFWQAMGSPSLAGLPPLWASSYPGSSAGTPAQLYANVTPRRWNGYGGLGVAVLQFADTGIVAGYQPVDVDAYLGTSAQFAQLLGQAQPAPLIATSKGRKMREIHLHNPADATGNIDLSGLLTIDAVGKSIVMPAGSRAWCQWSASCPRNTNATANVWWLVERHADGTAKAINPFPAAAGKSGAFELSQGAVAIEVGVENAPPGYTFAAHLDCVGHG
ncbi:MAG TPA: GH25 family lysozyme [Pseudonocardiaceae bacterium]|jgi:GH25 family lysozyme M1 (1,4-beta-N-acetylmuramidase)